MKQLKRTKKEELQARSSVEDPASKAVEWMHAVGNFIIYHGVGSA